MPAIKTNSHSTLASYFASKPLYLDEPTQKKPNTRKLVEQPWQQTKGEMWDEVTNTLCNLDFIQAKSVAKMTYELVNDFNAALEVIPDNAENIRKEKERQVRMDKYIKNLFAYAYGKFKELELPESITLWTKEQTEAEIERIKTKPTRLDKLIDFLNFLGLEAGNLQNFTSEFAYFTYQQAWNYSDNGPVGRFAENINVNNRMSLLLCNKTTRPQWIPFPNTLKRFEFIEEVSSVAVTPDGNKAILGSYNNCIIFDLANGKIIHTLSGHTSFITSVAIDPNSKLAITGSNDKTCILWDVNAEQPFRILKGHFDKVNSVAISPEIAISCSDDHTCIVWDLYRGIKQQILKGHTDKVNSVAITPDGKKAISGSHDNNCIIWEYVCDEKLWVPKVLKGHTSYIKAVAISNDGKWAISGSDDCTCIHWDLISGLMIKKLIGHNSTVTGIAITADSKRVITGSWDMTCIIWDLNTGKSIKKLRGHSFGVTSVAITADGNKAISGSADKSIVLWDIERGMERDISNGHIRRISSVSVSSDGRIALTASKDKTCIKWDLITNKNLLYFKENVDGFFSVEITPDQKRALTGSENNICNLWNLATGEKLLSMTKHTRRSTQVTIHPTGKYALSGNWDNYDYYMKSPDLNRKASCIYWDLTTGKIINIWEVPITVLLITPDGKCAISNWQKVYPNSYPKASYKVWLLSSMFEYANDFSELQRIAITPDGKKTITSVGRECKVWKLSTGNLLLTFEGHIHYVCDIAVSPDGKRACSISMDGMCILWDLESGQKLAVLKHSYLINRARFFLKNILFSCLSGEILILNPHKNLAFPGIVITTIRQIWDFELQQYQPLSADCPLCGHRFAPPASVLATIEEITKKAGLKPEQSPCLELPDEAWEEPGLLGNCPSCGEALKFNPFVAGGE